MSFARLVNIWQMQLDHSLKTHPFVPSTEKQPINTHYQSYTSTSATETSVRFNVDTPFAGAMLDNEVYVEYKVRIQAANVGDLHGMFEAHALGGVNMAREDAQNALPAALYQGKFALRQGFAVHNGLESVNLKLNGQSMTQRPQVWMNEFMRFYASEDEVRNVCSMSGGEFDCGDFSYRTSDDAQVVGSRFLQDDAIQTTIGVGVGYSPPVTLDAAAGGAGVNTINLRTSLPISDHTYSRNSGFEKRFHRLAYKARLGAGEDGTANANDTEAVAPRHSEDFVFSVWERVPISPFMLWEAKDGKRSIPYVDKMELQLRFSSNEYHSVQGVLGTAAGAHIIAQPDHPHMSILGAGGAEAPILHLKWYIPPAGFVMEPEKSIPITIYEELPNTGPLVAIGDAAYTSVSYTANYRNIRLQQIPDLLFIYLKPEESAANTRFSDPAEKHLEIEKLKITVNGDSGKLDNASSGELYSMYVRNSPMAKERLYNYDEWRRKYCTAVLKPRDMGVKFGPGINHGVTLDVEVTAKSWWNLPAVHRVSNINLESPLPIPSTQYELYVVAAYDRYELTLTNRGNAQLKLLNIPSPARDQQLAQPDALDLRRALG